MKKKQKASTSRRASRPAVANQIWRTVSVGRASSAPGLVVTHGDSVDRPIAFIPIDKDATPKQALRAARRIARDPAFALRSDYAIPIECRRCEEMPGWVYGLNVVPFDAPELASSHWLRPFCPVRYRRMQRQAAEISSGGRWWEARGYKVISVMYVAPGRPDSFNIEVKDMRLAVPVTVGTIAVVLHHGPGASDVADRIAANLALLDTLRSPHIIDLRV